MSPLPPPSREFLVYVCSASGAWEQRAAWGTYEAARDEAIDIHHDEGLSTVVRESRVIFSLGVGLP